MNIPYHPLLVHFPIGFVFAALILHTIYLIKPNWTCRVVSIWLTGFAATSSLLASISGQLEYQKALSQNYSADILKTLETHQIMGNLTSSSTLLLSLGFIDNPLIVFVIIWLNIFFKKMDDKRIDFFAFVVLLFLVGGITFTSYLGGTLVWEYGVGIK